MADVNQIYDRLNSGTQYVPLSADTFGDWSLEAGDIVTVQKDGKTYTTPVMTGHMVWNGACRMGIESTGNQKRDPLSKQSKQQYADGVRGGGGYYGAKKSGEDHAWLEDTEDHVSMVAEKIFGYGPDGKPNWAQIAEVRVDENGIRGTVEETKNGLTLAKSEIKQTKNSISAVVDGNGVVTPASLILAINGNRSSAKLSADQITLDGNVSIKRLLTGDAAITSLKVNDLLIAPNSGMGYVRVANAITNLKIVQNGNNYTLQKLSFNDSGWKDVASFSRATTLSGSWSSGILTVNAAPQNQKITANLSQGGTNWDGNYATVQVMSTNSDRPGSLQYTGRDMYVDATARYRAGQATRPTVATSTSERPSGATDLQSELYISASIKTIVITIGSNRWYCKVST